MSNVSHLISENNLNNRRNLRANIEKQSLLVNEQFLSIFEDTYRNFQKLSNHVTFINNACNEMMNKVEVIFFEAELIVDYKICHILGATFANK